MVPSFAEEQPKTYRIKEVKVVASPIIQGNELDNYASQKTTVSEEQIHDLNAQDLASASGRPPG